MKPGIGMSYGEAATRIKRIMRNPGHPQYKENIINSIRNQCQLAEGKAAITHLDRDILSCHNSPKRSSSLTGAGTKQIGIGSGVKLGDGKWKYENGKWVPAQP